MTTARIVMWLATILAVVTLGCTGVPDRGREARQLQDTLAAMPGVSSANVVHENDAERGALLYDTVWMPEAPRQQIVDVVNRINEMQGDHFDGYARTATFQVTPDRRSAVECGANLDAATIADQAVILREVSSRITVVDADASCEPAERRITLRDNETPIPQVLESLQAVDAGLDGAEIMSGPVTAGMAPFSMVDIRFPFTMDDWNRFQNLVSRMDGTPWSAGVGPGGAVGALGVRVRDPAVAHQQLSNVITEFDAGPQRPMRLSWTLENPPQQQRLKFWGSVDVGGCKYGTPTLGDQNPEKYYTPESIALQKSMRARYDTCGK